MAVPVSPYMPPKRPRQPDNDIEPTAIVRSSRESKKCNESVSLNDSFSFLLAEWYLFLLLLSRCRRRHVKCDEQRPKCGNCVKSNAECSYSHSGMRYDHISDRQKRDDMYTEIDDISKRVEGLLAEAQSEVDIEMNAYILWLIWPIADARWCSKTSIGLWMASDTYSRREKTHCNQHFNYWTTGIDCTWSTRQRLWNQKYQHYAHITTETITNYQQLQ